jgi:hypothetical protein
MCGLQLAQRLHQPVIFPIADDGIVQGIVAIGVEVELVAQLRDPPFGL